MSKMYYTLVLPRTVPAFTNEWNTCPPGWTALTRGNFPTEQAACERAREMLLHGAPFTVKCIADEANTDETDGMREVVLHVVDQVVKNDKMCPMCGGTMPCARLTVGDLANLLHEEFERDSWGTIDPYLFTVLAGREKDDYADRRNVDSMRLVLKRIVDRLNTEMGK